MTLPPTPSDSRPPDSQDTESQNTESKDAVPEDLGIAPDNDRHQAAEGPCPWIVHVTDADFETQVLVRSQLTPVVVDFWAAWCQPCRMLGPLLEQLAIEYDGQFVLAKADTDRVPTFASQFQVQAIPAVFALFDGQVVDQFQGVLPQTQLRQWIETQLVHAQLRNAELAVDDQPEQAVELFRRVLEQQPLHPQASVGLARVELARGNVAAAKQLIEQLEGRGYLEAEAEKVKAALKFQGRPQVEIESLRQAAAARPDDPQLHLDLAQALVTDQQFQAAMDLCLKIIEHDKAGVGDEARRLMIDVFRLLPDDSPLTSEYRRRLATLLY